MYTQYINKKEMAQPQDSVQCTQMCSILLNQVQLTYTPAYSKTNDVFVTLCGQETKDNATAVKFAQASNPTYSPRSAIQCEVNSIVQTLACWGLSRVRQSENQFALRETSLFLTNLQEAAEHLARALALDSTLKDALQPQVADAPPATK